MARRVTNEYSDEDFSTYITERFGQIRSRMQRLDGEAERMAQEPEVKEEDVQLFAQLSLEAAQILRSVRRDLAYKHNPLPSPYEVDLALRVSVARRRRAREARRYGR